MAKRKRNASADTRGGEGAGEAAPGRSVGTGGTSTDQPTSQKSLDIATLAAAYDAAIPSRRMTAEESKTAAQALWQDTPANGHSNPHRGSTFEAKDFIAPLHEADVLGLSATGVRPISRDQAPATTPSVVLKTVEQQEAFADAVVEHEGIKPAARAWGLKSSAVFFHASTHPDFRKILNAAQGAVFEDQVYKLDELCNKLLTMEPREMNQCANAYGRVFDYRMRIVGKLLPVIYGDRPGTQVNIQNNTGIVCTEEQRAKLIDLNQKLLTAGSTTSNQEQ